MLQGTHEGGILSLVVGHLAKAPGVLDRGLPLAPNDEGVGCRARVAARGAVGMDVQYGSGRHGEPRWDEGWRSVRGPGISAQPPGMSRPAPGYYPGKEVAHTNPTRQRGNPRWRVGFVC